MAIRNCITKIYRIAFHLTKVPPADQLLTRTLCDEWLLTSHSEMCENRLSTCAVANTLTMRLAQLVSMDA